MNKVNGMEIGRFWEKYELSPDGTQLVLITDQFQVVFKGISSISLLPLSSSMQEEEAKEILSFSETKLNKVDPSVKELFGVDIKLSAVRVGPPHRCVYYVGSREGAKHYRGFHFDGDDLEFSLTATRFELVPRE